MVEDNVNYGQFFELYPFDSAVNLSIRKAQENIYGFIDNRVNLYKRIDAMKHDFWAEYDTATASVSDLVYIFDIVQHQIEKEIFKNN
jgi:hypothetical protein